jgi:HlyD family secretion protein
MPAAIDLIDTGCLYVSAPIDEVDAPLIRAGLAAHVSFDALPVQRFPGRVRRVAPYIRDLEKQARTVEIEVALQGDAMAGLLPGYTADVEVVIERREAVLRVPVEALLDGDAVLLFEPVTRRLVRRALEIGLRNWQLAEVRGGLVAGDRIALAPGRDGVVAGAVVTPLAEHGAAQ